MPRPRFEKLSEARRTLILETAAKAFAQHGYSGASLNQIVDEAGVSKGAAYYYFDDKADLFITAITYCGQLLLPDDTLDLHALTADTFWPALARVYQRPFIQFAAQPWVFGATKAAASAPPEVAARLGPLVESIMSALAVVLQRGQALGTVRTDLPDELLLALVQAVDDASDRWLLAHRSELSEAEIEVALDRTIDLFRRLLAPAKVPNSSHV